MPKLIIEIEGTTEELEQIAGHFSDGGGEDAVQPFVFEKSNKGIGFEYTRCFPAWGYDPTKDGPDLVITGLVSTD